MDDSKPRWDFDEFVLELGKSTTKTAITEMTKDVASQLLGKTISKISEAALMATIGWMVGPLIEVLFRRSNTLKKEINSLKKQVDKLQHEVYFGPLLRGHEIAYKTLKKISRHPQITPIDIQEMKYAVFELQTAEKQWLETNEKSERKLSIFLLQAICAIWPSDMKKFARERLKQCKKLIEILLKQAKRQQKVMVNRQKAEYERACRLEKDPDSYGAYLPIAISPFDPLKNLPPQKDHGRRLKAIEMLRVSSSEFGIEAESLERKITSFKALSETVKKLLAIV